MNQVKYKKKSITIVNISHTFNHFGHQYLHWTVGDKIDTIKKEIVASLVCSLNKLFIYDSKKL